MSDFFISYTLADRPWAEWISWHLAEAQYTVVVQFSHFTPGSNFVLDMHRALSEAARTIAVISPDYLQSLYANAEWAAAFVADPASKQGKLIPVRVKKCELTGLLASIVYIDLVDLQDTDAEHALIGGLNEVTSGARHRPKFPGETQVSRPRPPRFPASIGDRNDTASVPRLAKYTQKLQDLASFRKFGVQQEVIDEFARKILGAWYEET